MKILSTILILFILASAGFCEIVYSKVDGKLVETEVQEVEETYSLEEINKRIIYFTYKVEVFTAKIELWNKRKTEAEKLGVTE